jgi:predicted DNA-binding transcriptional regulator AlpA
MEPTEVKPADLIGALTIKQFCKFAGIGRSKYYDLVLERSIVPRMIGTKPVILMEEAREWLRSLESQ